MDLAAIAKLLKPIAPTVATMLGGPLAGIAVNLLGGFLGLGGDNESPITAENIGKAIEQGGDVIKASLVGAEEEAKARYGYLTEQAKADASQSASINETMRMELGQQRWYSWRNLWGYSCVIEISLTSLLILHELFTGDFKAINAFIQLSGFFLSWYGMRIGVLGFVVSRSSAEKTAALTGESPSVIGAIAKVFKK